MSFWGKTILKTIQNHFLPRMSGLAGGQRQFQQGARLFLRRLGSRRSPAGRHAELLLSPQISSCPDMLLLLTGSASKLFPLAGGAKALQKCDQPCADAARMHRHGIPAWGWGLSSNSSFLGERLAAPCPRSTAGQELPCPRGKSLQDVDGTSAGGAELGGTALERGSRADSELGRLEKPSEKQKGSG